MTVRTPKPSYFDKEDIKVYFERYTSGYIAENGVVSVRIAK